MKRNPLTGTGKVYAFTLKQMVFAKGWLASTIIIAMLLLLGIPLLLWAVSSASVKDNSVKEEGEAFIKSVLVVDDTEGEADYSVLLQGVDEKDKFAKVTFTPCEKNSADKTLDGIADADSTVLLHITKPDSHYLVTVVLPENSRISRSDASSLASFVQTNFAAITMQKAKLTPEGIMLLNLPVSTEAVSLSNETGTEKDEGSAIEKTLGFIVPFLMLMLMYMMVLLYGQSVANSVMLEKNSKLIESMLTAVNPIALMAGKLLSGASAAVIQLLIWVAALFGGIFGGAVFAIKMVPDTQNSTVNTVNMIMESDLPISISGLFVGLLVIALGFLLYLSLSCLSGALASKQEDLNKTNVIFTLVLVVSFFICFGTSMNNLTEDSTSLTSDAPWIRIFPFTAILVVPGELLLGKMSAGMTAGCLAALIVGVILFVMLAATVYKMLVFYRGKVPSPKELIAMFKDSRKQKK